MYVWGLLDIESTLLNKNEIWQNKMYMNQKLGFPRFVTSSNECKQ